MSDVAAIEARARAENSREHWDRIWSREEESGWRKDALSQVYTRIERLMPPGAVVIDLGGGPGVLAKRLVESRGCVVEVWDHSRTAIEMAASGGTVRGRLLDLEGPVGFDPDPGSVVVGTEIIEHLSEAARERVLRRSRRAFFSVPHDRLDHDDEPQHTVSFTALGFLQYLRRFYFDARVEVLGPYLLGVCGFPRPYRLSVCMPVRDEAADLASTLASFRGVADQIVIGIDPRTKDETRAVAERFAETVFDIDQPEGQEGDRVPDGGVNFAWVRNQCLDRCTGDWVFMTEGHERLLSGEDVLLALDRVVPKEAEVGYVMRTGNGQRWAFPWLQRPRFRYKRPTHNILDIPEGTYAVKLPQVITLHERAADRSRARAEQRKIQNRKSLMDDWLVNRNENSLFYLGQEWRESDADRARACLAKFLATSHNGPARYQARLMLAKMLAREGKTDESATVLHGASADDWSRTEHWIWLGDLAYHAEQYDRALQFYRYAGTAVNEPPFTLWWIDLASYSYLAAQRLALCYAELGRYKDALPWARRVRELLPDDAPSAAFEEVDANIKLLTEAIGDNDDHS